MSSIDDVTHAMNEVRIVHLETPLGPMLAALTDPGLAALERGDDDDALAAALGRRFPAAAIRAADDVAFTSQLGEYFAGMRRSFDIDVNLAGLAAFDRRALSRVRGIPYGETMTYGEVAAELGNPGAARAVGNALSRCPITIVIPCHRVVRAADGLSGWGGSFADKRRLLELEATVTEASATSDAVCRPGK